MKQLPVLTKERIQSGFEKTITLFALQLLLLILTGGNAQPRDIHGLDPTAPSMGRILPFAQSPESEESPGLILPTRPSFLEQSGLAPMPKIVVKKIEVKGSTVFSDQELGQITAPYLDQILTNEMLEEIQHLLTLHYISKGYVNSGAIVPDQKIIDGKIIFKIIEGSITHIDVNGNKWFTRGYIQDRLALDSGPPLNLEPLQKRLQQLQQDRRIAHIHAELKPGMALGESLMSVEVEEENPCQIQFGFDNYQPPAIGAQRWLANITHQNLTGHGDILSLNTVLSKENDPQVDTWYSLPINAHDTTLTFRYSNNDLRVFEGPFEDLDIVSKSEMFRITLRHPFYRTLSQEFAMALSGENNRNKTFLLDEPFSFSPGAIDGESINTVLRFSQDWTHSTQRQVVAARSQFSLGIDEMNSTIHSSNLPDSRFFAWLGQIQWASILSPLDTQLIFRTDLQLSSDSLLGFEQIPVGGRYSVRGYRENLMVRDQGLLTSIEARIPLVRDKDGTEYLQLATFFDLGAAWNKNGKTPFPKNISSIGLGLRWGGLLMKTPFKVKPKFEIYWALPLRNVDTVEEDLQDKGIHFQFVIQNF